jgi:hypothetical protein
MVENLWFCFRKMSGLFKLKGPFNNLKEMGAW